MHDITQPPDATLSESTESDGGTTPEVSRKVRKHHKRSRSKTIAPRRLTKEELTKPTGHSRGQTARAGSGPVRGCPASTTCFSMSIQRRAASS